MIRRTAHGARRTLFLLALLTTPAASQVDPSGSWRTLHTEHFRIHFHPAYRGKAIEAANEAERAYRLLSTELHPPRGIVDVTLSDDIDTPNGFTSTYPSNRFTILLVPPVTDPGLQTYDSWERLVIVHELTHVFHLDRSRGIWGALQSVFGRAPGLFPNQYQPSWVTEGIATYYESRFTTGGRAAGGFHRQLVAADGVYGHARSPWDATLFTRWPSGLAPYAYGSRFFEFLSQTQGDSVVPRFAEQSAGQLIPFRVGRPLRHAGVPRALTESWTRAIATAADSGSLVTHSRLLVGGMRSEPVPRVSPDGRAIAYLYDDGRGARQLRVVDLQTFNALRSHPVNGQVSYDWAGDTLLLTQLDFTGRWKLRSDLYRWMPPPNGAWQRVTTDGRVMEPRAGGGVASMLQFGRGQSVAVYGPVVRMDSTANWGPAAPSPDGRWIVAPRHQNGGWALVRWPVEAGTAPRSITVLAEAPDGSAISDPVWSGDTILFVSDASGLPQVDRWTEGAAVEQLTAEPRGARAPAPLPDGRILFTTPGDDGWELRVVTPHAMPVAAPLSTRATPFDTAPRVAMRETGYSSWGSLRPHFWLPLGLDAGLAGRFLGAATAGTDAVGRYSYFAEGLVSGSPERAEGSFALIDQALGDPTFDFAAANDWSLVGVDSTGHEVSEDHIEAALGASVVAHRWRSYVALRLAAEYDGRRFVSIPDTNLADICIGCDDRDRIGGSASLSLGSAVAAPLAVSLQNGASASLLYRYKAEQGTHRQLNEVRARGNLYLRLGPRVDFAYPVLAIRGAFGALDGEIPDHLSVGGVSSGALQLGYGPAIGTFRTFPVRGYRAGELRGRRAATLTAEYRVPLALIGHAVGHLPLGADKLSLAVFGDAGDAWNVGERARLTRLRSVGAELVGDLTVSYDLPLEVRVGIAQPATGHAQLYAAFAADF